VNHPPSFLFAFSGLGMIAVALIAVFFWQPSKRSMLLRFFLLGALAWIVGVSLKIAWAIPTNSTVRSSCDSIFGAGPGVLIYSLYIGLLTGVFECGVTYLFSSKTRLKKSEWQECVAFGIGFGAIESFLLGLVDLVSIVVVICFFDFIPSSVRANLVGRYSELWTIPVPILERASTLLIHVYASVLILYGVRVCQNRWFWYSFFFKTGIDAFACWSVIIWKIKVTTSAYLQFELIIFLVALASVAGLRALKPRFKEDCQRLAQSHE
jgi:uncharacterized membrane protein YhfC